MSRVRANKLTNRAGSGAPELTYGAEVPVGYGITGAGGINISGMVTATAGFAGDATGLNWHSRYQREKYRWCWCYLLVVFCPMRM